ncbi:MAG: DNA polymerase III subunit alpha [Fibromonadaceae bacterium]|jgi:DNA polymerase-3 subunit alpha|nr:DNA polymerase III subunit alpha [Fibromonadaceae bacterium]
MENQNEKDFVHLQVHSEYSFLQAPVRIMPLLKKAKELKQNAIALTDHGFMFGILNFYMEMDKKKELKSIKRILGSHIYIETDAAKTNDKSSYNRLTLLAENQEGYKNLVKITSEPYIKVEKFQEIPVVSLKFLSQHKEGLIAIAGDTASRFGRDVCGNMENRARTFLDDLCKIFDYEHIYFSLQNHFLDTETQVNDFLRKYAAENNRQLVVTNNVHYLSRQDAQSHAALLCMEQKKKFIEFNDEYFSSDEFYLKSAEEMYELFPNDTEALENTVKIAERCNVEIRTRVGSAFWPRFECPPGFTEEYDYLEHLVKDKVSQRYTNGLNDEKIMERIQIELATIKQLNVPGYFLIIQDFISWAKEEGIPMGPGRGSAAGSIVAYILGITELDPLPYNLLFERFLNPERVSMPDIDIDVSDKDRSRLIHYVTKKYGDENVTQLITYGRMKAKAVLWAVGRVLDMSRTDVGMFADKIPFKLPVQKDAKGDDIDGSDKVNLTNVRNYDDELNSLIDSTDAYKEFWDLATKLEGLISNSGTHAAALIIAPYKMTELVPIYRLTANPEDVPAVQYDKHYIEDIGLLKMDILGLRNLSMIQDTVNAVKETRKLDLDIDKIPLTDERTFDIFKQGYTIGIFQFESPGMRKYLRELKPSCIEDLIAMNALYRPGPMDNIPRFVKCKHGLEQINCYHQDLEQVLGETYGVIVYQEQVMRLTQVLSGFSLGKADILRRAMGKKEPEDMLKMKPEFIENGLEREYPKPLLEKIWDDLKPFCGYAFNKSHSATYSYVAYQTAYLKANFPQEYMAAVMSCEKMENLPMIVDECKRMGIKVLPPDVNSSRSAFNVEGKMIRWGLSQIKGCGEIVARNIELDRKQHGPYKNIFDMVRRLHLYDKVTINKIALESLAKAGALDSLTGTRAQKFASVELALADAASWKVKKQSAQMSFFGSDLDLEPDLIESTEWSFLDSLMKEQKMLGVQISAHPLDEYYAEIKGFANFELCSREAIYERVDSYVKIAVLVSGISEKPTKNGETIAILTLQDKHDKLEAFCGTKKWASLKGKIFEGSLIIASGMLTISSFNNRPQLMLGSFEFLEDKIKQAKTFYINVKSDLLALQNTDIGKFFKEHNRERGCPLCFYVAGENGYQYKMETEKYKIMPKKENLKSLISIFGKENVWFDDE